MYNPVHRGSTATTSIIASEAERAQWIEYYDALADRVVKPTLAPPDNPRVTALPFYGYDPALQVDPADGAAQAVRHPPRRP